ncbi:hypothetical protein B0A49_00327 [Cryomyces minteri]|uniref:CoA-binding domain-containing protein n=1 Tax=Cryomyces minteri TaxID=331657 RepID=A0A4U0XZ88_9PEZI|nr:hypothetical protein B0A49_00327 [Cryomyces minteri]
MEAAVKTFFSSPRFAVAGASSDTRKLGHKVFVWYLNHNLPVAPLNPHSSSITALSTTHPTLASPSALPAPTETALSIITPPAVTLQVLKEAKEAGVPAVWLQPGSFDARGLEYAQREFGAAVGGRGGRGGEGWCVLVDGEWGMGLAGRAGEKL